MDWFVAAIVSAITLSGQALGFQRLQPLYHVRVYLTYIWLGAAFLLGLVFLRPDDFPVIAENIIPLVLSGICSWGGIYTFNQAIKTQNNLGYIQAVVAYGIVIAYIYSIIAFDAAFDLPRLIGVILIMAGVLLVAGIQKFDIKEFQIEWLSWALLSGLLFSFLTIFVRYATNGGVAGEVAIVIVLLVAGLLFLVSSISTGLSLKPRREDLWIILGTIAFATVGNAAEFIALQKAPNLAYAVAIDNTRMIILYIIGLVLFSEKLQRNKAIGIGITFLGVILLS